jgi:hypothetical protein
VFMSAVVIVFQSIFYLKIHQNNIFFYFLNFFLITAHKNNLKITKKIFI